MDFSITFEGPEASDYLCTNWSPKCLPTEAKRLPTNPHHLPEFARCTCKQQIIRKSAKEKEHQMQQLKHSGVSDSACGDAAVPVSLPCLKQQQQLGETEKSQGKWYRCTCLPLQMSYTK